MNKQYGLWGGFIVGTVVLVFLLAKLASTGGSSSPAGTVPAQTTVSIAPVTQEENIKGNEDAAVTLVEYGDFQCPACSTAAPFVSQLESDLGDQMRVVFRHLPLRSIHKNAQLSSQAAQAAAKQGKFWDMHDFLYENQKAWSNLSSSNFEAYLLENAETLGLDATQFEQDLYADDVVDKVNADLADATQAGIQSTPTFVLNGKKITFSFYEDLKQAVEAEIAATGPVIEVNSPTITIGGDAETEVTVGE